VEIGKVEERDASELASLLAQMGRPMTPEQAWRRVSKQIAHDDYAVWGARIDSRLIGVAIGNRRLTMASDDPAATLALLVVDESARGRGVGTALIEAFERWAIAGGASLATVTSANHRLAAHRLYERLGYENTGVRLVKTLRPV
jgi:GNAT superfamily N-acetyltransferase